MEIEQSIMSAINSASIDYMILIGIVCAFLAMSFFAKYFVK
jgi:hypothetical protein